MKDLDDIIAESLGDEKVSREELERLLETREFDDYEKITRLVTEMRKGEVIYDAMMENPDSDYTLIREKIKYKVPIKRNLLWMTIAAGIALLFGISLLLFRDYSNKYNTKGLEAERAGKRYAELKLDNGEVYPLYPDDKELVIQGDNLSQIVKVNDLLVYLSEDNDGDLKYNTLSVPPGAEYNVVLSDGTKVYLNSGSEIRYPVSFITDERKVFLKGEAYFEVVQDTLKRFIVETEEMTTIVLGTSFNICAYVDRNMVATTLTEGVLQVIVPDNEYIIYPGTQIAFNKEDGFSTSKEVNTRMYTSWKDGYYFFDNVTLDEIMSTISIWYDINVVFEDTELRELSFFGYLKRYDDFDELLKKFEMTNEIKFIVNDKDVIIKK